MQSSVHHAGLVGLLLLASLPAFAEVKTLPARGPGDSPWFAAEKPKPLFEGSERESIHVTMRDGVRIAIDYFLPTPRSATDRFPTILHQTRYWRAFEARVSLELAATGKDKLRNLFLSQGYAWVSVDVRGTGASFGTQPFSWWPEEVRDGGEIVDWIIQQPWSDGKVGAMGVSYDGTAAEFLLVNEHPAVLAVAPRFSIFDVYDDIVFPGGIHLTWMTEHWGAANRKLDANEIPETLPTALGAMILGVRPVDADLTTTPPRSLLRAAVEEHRHNFDPHTRSLRITHRDDEMESGGIRGTIDSSSSYRHLEVLRRSRAAFYGSSGWFDGALARAAARRWRSLGRPTRLTLGPWDHGGRQNLSPTSRGPSNFPQDLELLRFFDATLKDVATGIEKEPPVHYFTMVEDRWKATDSWPPPGLRSASYFLSPERGLAGTAPTTLEEDRYTVDFTAGTGPLTRWRSLIGGLPNAKEAYANRAAEDRKSLVYESPVLEAPLEVTGHPTITLSLRCSTSDAALFAYLEDVSPDGEVWMVTEGQIRLLHRRLGTDPPYDAIGPYHSFRQADAEPLEPGSMVEVTFDLLPTSYLFRSGHRIRLVLAGADVDYFARIPADGDPPTFHIQLGGPEASRLDLPTMPRQ